MSTSSYNAFSQEQVLDRLDRLVEGKHFTISTMWLQGLWDQEDMWIAVRCYPEWGRKELRNNDKSCLVFGLWRHRPINHDSTKLDLLALDRRRRYATSAESTEAVSQ